MALPPLTQLIALPHCRVKAADHSIKLARSLVQASGTTFAHVSSRLRAKRHARSVVSLQPVLNASTRGALSNRPWITLIKRRPVGNAEFFGRWVGISMNFISQDRVRDISGGLMRLVSAARHLVPDHNLNHVARPILSRVISGRALQIWTRSERVHRSTAQVTARSTSDALEEATWPKLAAGIPSSRHHAKMMGYNLLTPRPINLSFQ
jgi:hypothetical protein